jgi:hypothetical protein
MIKTPNDSPDESSNTTGDKNVPSNNVGGGAATPPPTPNPFAEFDLAKLRIGQSFLNQGAAKKLLTTIPIRKPGKQDFVRVHPNEKYCLTAALIELKDDREIYIVLPNFAPSLSESEYFIATLYLCMNRQKVLTFWPVKLPGPDGRQMAWHTSGADAAERAMKSWIRVSANMGLGAYEIFEAEGTIPDPEWPDLAMDELLSIAFKNRIISGPEHPAIQKLRGLI